jgi:hypothetical protein
MSLGKLTIFPGSLVDFDGGLSGDIALAVLRVDNGTGEARQSARPGERGRRSWGREMARKRPGDFADDLSRRGASPSGVGDAGLAR